MIVVRMFVAFELIGPGATMPTLTHDPGSIEEDVT
jgi:hypothetical protein